MKDKIPARNGSFSDADLAADCDTHADALEANLDALKEEGMTVKMLTDFRTSITSFRGLPTADGLTKNVTAAVGKRDTALEAARSGLRRASQPIGRAFGNESAEYRSFQVGEVSRKTVTEVLNLLLTVPTVGAAYLTSPQALAEGYSEARLTPLPGLYQDLFALEAAVGKAETAAEQATRTRVLAYNALNTLCSAYCARGYDHFVELDASKAKLFVRNPASSADTPPPTPGLAA